VNVPLTGGGYWAGPTPGIAAGITLPEAMRRVQNGLTNGPLWKYASAMGAYHCPGDLRSKRKPGAGWAWDSYSKANGMNGILGWEAAQRPFLKATDVLSPSESFVFIEESDPRNSNLGTWVLSVASPGWIDPFALWGRHLRYPVLTLLLDASVDDAKLALVSRAGGVPGRIYTEFIVPGGASPAPSSSCALRPRLHARPGSATRGRPRKVRYRTLRRTPGGATAHTHSIPYCMPPLA
jgi:hypothetical protein